MSLSNVLYRRALHFTLQTPIRTFPRCYTTRIGSQLQPRWTSPAKSLLQLRHASAEAQAARSGPAVRYPERINIYRAGTFATVGTGLARVSTIVVFFLGACVYAPSFYLSPDHSNWWVPVFIFGSALPFFVTAFTTGPVVHAIRVWLPTKARRGKEELRKFSRDTPGDTTLEFQYMRWKPWLQTRTIRFDMIRRLRPSLKVGMANMEHIPDITAANQASTTSLMGRLVGRWLGRFWVSRDQRKDRSAVPAVWDGMWEQIPYKGSRADPEVIGSKEKRPVPMRGRPQSSQRLSPK